MFSSLASFLFGSNTTVTTNREQEQDRSEEQGELDNQQRQQPKGDANERIDADSIIDLTSSTPSVSGAGSANRPVRQVKRSKNKRTKANKSKGESGRLSQGPSQSAITRLLTPTESVDEDIDEDDWFIVDKENEEDSLPRSDSEDDVSIVEVKAKPLPPPNTVNNNNNTNNNVDQQQQQHRRRPHGNMHSLYSGPRPQQHRNYLQRSRNNGLRGGVLSLSALAPPRGVLESADGGVTQSLFVVPTVREGLNSSGGSGSENGANVSMEESWFITPPPCFTSIGPINMETSPFENLLIEHPSMSVYHSIRSAQEATESFVNLDLGVDESQQRHETAVVATVAAGNDNDNNNTVQTRNGNARLVHYDAVEAKKEMLARKSQKCREKVERQNVCRGALKRSNNAYYLQGKGNRQRRADMQHFKTVSGANNNRKCCY